LSLLGATILMTVPQPVPDVSAALLGAGSVTAEYGGSAFVNNSTRYNRYDFALTNNADAPEDLRVCPQDIVIAVHDHRVQSEPAFALSFDDGEWSRDCASYQLAPGQTVRLRSYFRAWWPHEGLANRRLKEVRAETSAGTFTMIMTRASQPGKLLVEVSSAYLDQP